MNFIVTPCPPAHEGPTKIRFATERIFEGNLKEGEGKGVLTSVDHNNLEGYLKNDIFYAQSDSNITGNGIIYFPITKTFFSGDYEKGILKKGTITGSKFLGNTEYFCMFKDWIDLKPLKQPKPTYKGKAIFNNDSYYEGTWNIHFQPLKGRITFKNGDFYEGEWKDGCPHYFKNKNAKLKFGEHLFQNDNLNILGDCELEGTESKEGTEIIKLKISEKGIERK